MFKLLVNIRLLDIIITLEEEKEMKKKITKENIKEKNY
jgi:hypothetical protein